MGPEDFLGLEAQEERLWIVICDVDKPKSQWVYTITRTDPSKIAEGRRAGHDHAVQVDSQPRQYSYEAIRQELATLGVPLSQHPEEAYFLPTKDERVDRIVRTVDRHNP